MMTESSLLSPYSESTHESSEDNLDNDSLDEEGPVADSGVSEAGSQLSEELQPELGQSLTGLQVKFLQL